MTKRTRKPELQFPCDFPIKAMGPADESFDAFVVGLIRRHVGDIREGAITVRQSRGGKYVSVTVIVQATSREQLDAIYRDLSADERVLMAL